MKRIDSRFWSILAKWGIDLAVVLVLWFTKVFHLVFILVLLLIQEFNLFLVWLSEPTQEGAANYWSIYWVYWAGIYIALSLLLTLWYFTWFRHKRPHLMIGGGKEGRVLWIKGIRRGLIYDLWDVKHYLQWKLKKNRLALLRRQTSDIPNGGRETTWPDPLSIQLGRPTSHRIIYYCRPSGLRIQRLILPNQIDLLSTLFTIQLPEGYMVNLSDPLVPGSILQAFVLDRPDYQNYIAGQTRSQILDHLNEVKDAVQASAAANPQLIHKDYEDGSFPILGEAEVSEND